MDAATGEVAQQIDYDDFGFITLNSNPNFQPFGFAGGLNDGHTDLIHFGARDYDARTGRFLQRDPVGFLGGDGNLYAYALNDPVNLTDPSGLQTCPAVPLAPPGADVVENIAFVEDELDDWRRRLQNPWTAPYTNPYEPFQRWAVRVAEGRPWDYKTQGSQFRDFGNFNYGATGAALGIPDEVLLRAAGGVQILSALEKGFTRGSPPFGQERSGYLWEWGTPLGGPPHGDDRMDRPFVLEGIEFYRNRCHLCPR